LEGLLRTCRGILLWGQGGGILTEILGNQRWKDTYVTSMNLAGIKYYNNLTEKTRGEIFLYYSGYSYSALETKEYQ